MSSYYEKIGDKVRCIDDEIPFEVPESWEWVRLENCCINAFSGKSPVYVKETTPYHIIGQQANQEYGIDFKYTKYCAKSFWETMSDEMFLRQYDVLLNTLGNGTLGRSGIILNIDRKILTDGHLFVFRTIKAETSLFLFYYFKANRIQIDKSANGTTNQTFLNLTSTKKWLIPFPPLAEQKRIVEQIENFELLLIKYDKLEQQKSLSDSGFPEKLKKSILQYAIQGKLVAQNLDEEPATILLEKIRKEKEQLIKEGKIKRDKSESFIYKNTEDNSYYESRNGKVLCVDDEIPFEIPENWIWVRLGSICNFGKTINIDSQNITNETWVLDLEDIEKDSGKLLQKKRKKEIKILSTKHVFEKGNVLYSKLRPYLNKVIIADENGCCTSEILPLNFGSIYNKYAQLVLMSPYFVDYTIQCSYGVKMPRLGTVDGQNALFPLPPVSEQKSIVGKIEQLITLLP